MSTAPRAATTPAQRQIALVTAGVALVAMLAVLAWMAMPPKGVVGPLSDAPFTLDAALVIGDVQDGCTRMVDGEGNERSLCAEIEEAYEAWFAEDGTVVVGNYESYTVFDEATGDVVRLVEGDEARRLNEERYATEPSFDPDGTEGGLQVWAAGDRVFRGEGGQWPCFEDRCVDQSDAEDTEVLLDLRAGPGYQLYDVVLSPDGRWIVMSDSRGEVLVAAIDGPGDAYVWLDATDGFVDLRQGIRWG